MVRISEIQQFPEFLETIQGNFWTFVTADIYESFGWMKGKELAGIESEEPWDAGQQFH